MRCPLCGADEDRVVDSRAAEDGVAIRRRRACGGCGQRYSTYERAEQAPLVVRKRSGDVEPFIREKLRSGIEKSLGNRAVPADAVRRATAQVEAHVRELGRREVSSERLGAETLEALRGLDTVAYMRYASVYKGFTSPEDFRRELAHLEKDEAPGTTAVAAAGPDGGESAV